MVIFLILSAQCIGAKVAVIGCGGSGTHFMAQVLSTAGLSIGHEKMGKDGIVSHYETPFANHSKYEVIIHQVRHPLKVIKFIMTANSNSWNYYMRYVPEIKLEDTLIVKASKYWYYWNYMAQKRADYRYQLENFSNEIPALESILNISIDRNTEYKYYSREDRSNQILGVKELTWDYLDNLIDNDLFGKIQNLAVDYGYEL